MNEKGIPSFLHIFAYKGFYDAKIRQNAGKVEEIP